MLIECVNNNFGKIICNNNDNIEILKEQCEKIIQKLDEILLMRNKENLKFDIVIENGEMAIPKFFSKGNEKTIKYPKRILEVLKKEEYCPDLIHEIVHAIWFCNENIFLSEGIAVGISYYLSKNTYYPFQLDAEEDCLFQSLVSRVPKDVYLYLKKLEDDLNMERLTNLFKQDFEISQQNLYAVAGSFIIFLIDNFGVERLGKILSSDEFFLSDIYGLSEEQMLKKWINLCLELKKDENEQSYSNEVIDLMNYDWTFSDDSKIGGTSKLSFKKENNEVNFGGRIGSGAPFNGGIVGVILRNQDIDFSKYKNLVVEISGTNIQCEIITMTKKHDQPGKEPVYMVQCKPELVVYTIPLERFKIISNPTEEIDIEYIVAICCRVINKAGTKFEINIKSMHLS